MPGVSSRYELSWTILTVLAPFCLVHWALCIKLFYVLCNLLIIYILQYTTNLSTCTWQDPATDQAWSVHIPIFSRVCLKNLPSCIYGTLTACKAFMFFFISGYSCAKESVFLHLAGSGIRTSDILVIGPLLLTSWLNQEWGVFKG